MFKYVILMIVCFLHSQVFAKTEYKSYQNQQAWKDLQQFFPESYQLKSEQLPKEFYWNWKDYKIHADHYPQPQSRAKIILLHGVGTNGRQMSLVLGHPLAQAGYETFALDLPGYGLSLYPSKSKIRYEDWVNLVNDFVNVEAAKDNRPIFLYGLSAGGMLTMHVAMHNKNIKGIIGMTFLDQQQETVKKGTMRFSPASSIILPSMKFTAKTPIGDMPLPMSLVSKMSKLTNNPQALKVMLKDKSSGGNAMSIKFLNSYINYQPVQSIQDFSQCPVLLTQPQDDAWTPLELSQPVLDKLKVNYKVVILPQGGHYPIEQPALDQLKQSSVEFIETNLH